MLLHRPRAILIDVGFTLTTYDSVRMVDLVASDEIDVTPEALALAEGPLRAELSQYSWPMEPKSAKPKTGGVRFLRRILELGGARGSAAALDAAAERLWSSHLEKNLMSRVLEGVVPALDGLALAQVRLAVVSNAEGTVEAMLREQGLRSYFGAVCDSWVVGFAKPDPRIFSAALDALAVQPDDAIMVGDSPNADVSGARGAGMVGVLIDPFGLHADHDADRFPTFAAFAEAVLQLPPKY